MSTSLLALCCQSGLDATLATPTRARSRSVGRGPYGCRRSGLRVSPRHARLPGPARRKLRTPSWDPPPAYSLRGHQLFRGDTIDEQQEPGSQCFQRWHRLSKLLLRCGQLFELRPINRVEKFARVGKWRYKVPGPTPDSLAMSSRLAFAPKRVNASFATSRMRSRLRWASARGFPRAECERFFAMGKNIL